MMREWCLCKTCYTIGQNYTFCMAFWSAVREMVKITFFFCIPHPFSFLLQTFLGKATPANN